MGHVLVRMETEVGSLEEFESALQIAGDEECFREVELLVRIQDGDVDGREPLARGLCASEDGWRREWDSKNAISRSPMKSTVSRLTLAIAII